MSDNNKTWAAFWSENKPLVWFITLVVTVILGYLIYNKWGIVVGNAILTPPIETKEVESEVAKVLPDKQVPEKSTQKQKNTNPISPQKPETSNHSKNDKRHDSSMSGNIIQENGEPAINAKVICSNCLTSNSPVFSDQIGRFKINYSIEYKEIEYPTKTIELTVIHQNKTYSAFPSISQNSLKIELK